jgi:FAD/FMN-containing dehydrogenase
MGMIATMILAIVIITVALIVIWSLKRPGSRHRRWMRVGQTSEFELERKIRDGGREGEIYRKLKTLRDRYSDLIRKRFPKIPRRVSGYNLDELLPENGFHVARALVGSEGTCVTILEASVRLVESPRKRALVVLGYSDIYIYGDHVSEILSFKPIGLEGLDRRLVSQMKVKGLECSVKPSLILIK